jgi:alpha-maltose-1-phosphate synthase
MSWPMAERFALHCAADDGVDADADAHAGLVRAIAEAADVAAVGCFGVADQARECERALRSHGCGAEVVHIARDRPQDIAPFGTLYRPGVALDRLAWRRLGVGERGYSLCGGIDSVASHAAMTAVAGLLVAPLRGWDALVCPSRAVRDSVREVLERQADYLRARLGAQRFELPQLPLIPPGVHCQDVAPDPGRRAAVRARLGIGADDVAFLVRTGTHPQQLFAALERAAQGCAAQGHAGKDGRRLHLLLCGGSADEERDAALREAAAALCPSVRLAVLDGDGGELRRDALAMADVFTALADGVQPTPGLTAREAMAAGLPCVVGDWGGDRDTVRDGVDGYRIPTLMPPAGAGLDLAQRYDDGVDSYALYCGHTSQVVALDGALMAQAYERLVADADLRRELGANAGRRAREAFDWRVVFARYRMVWSELDERRRADAVLAPALPASVPDRLDPFALFATYPSMQVTPLALVELAPDASLALVRRYRELALNRGAVASLPTLEEFGQIFGSIGSRPMQADELLDALGPCDRPDLLRGLAWLAKMDLLRIRAAPTE